MSVKTAVHSYSNSATSSDSVQVHRVPVLVPIYELGQAHRIMHESADTLAVGDAVRPLEVSECEKTTCSL